MANKRLVDLETLVTPADDDIVYALDIDAGGLRDRKVTVGELRKIVLEQEAPPIRVPNNRVEHQFLFGTCVGVVPLQLVPEVSNRIESADNYSLVFSALFSASLIDTATVNSVMGYKLEGLARHQVDGGLEIVGTPFRTTFGEEIDCTVDVGVNVGGQLVFLFTNTTPGISINVTCSVTLVYAIGGLPS